MNAPDFAQMQMFRSREQFRMSALQVFNWGTFDKLHTVPIAEKGFLFVGRSGSGKTTLLDAISALLVPPRWVNFNAAAQDAERRGRDRNLTTYIRGAWAEQKDDGSGEVATQYLRRGTTWSAIALTYTNTNGRTVSLVQLFWLKGNASGAGDVKRHYVIFERVFDLSELDDFDLDLRRLKHKFQDGHHFSQFSAYCERFRRLLDIDNEMALRLLHKTQSAKNLGDLNTFLRDFMLERPPTFDVAETLVNEFGELNEAHQSVVTARQQVELLKPAQRDYEHWTALGQQHEALEKLRVAVDPYRDACRKSLLEQRLAQLHTRAEGLAGEIRAQEHELDNHRQGLRDLEEQHRQLGGDQIENLKSEKQRLEEQRADRLRKREQARQACQKLGWQPPDSATTFVEITSEARRELDDWQGAATELRAQQFDLATAKKEAEKAFAETVKEVEAMRRQPSNIPAHMLALRNDIAQSLGLNEQSLPFVGELIDVTPEAAPWRGAIERVLHGFALSLLVDPRHYNALSNHVNETNLGGRLIYYRTGSPRSVNSPVAIHSLARKLKLKEGPQETWLKAELESRFDYTCVDSMQAFRKHERALTQEGQIRHGASCHEKDDRREIADARYWVLGFDNRDKRTLYEQQAQELAEKISQITDKIRTLEAQEETRRERAMSCQTLVNLQWHEVDVAPLEERLAQIIETLERLLSGNAALQDLDRQITQKRQIIHQVEEALLDKRTNAREVDQKLRQCQHELTQASQDVADSTLMEGQRQDLDLRLEKLGQKVTLEKLDKQMLMIERGLADELSTIAHERNRLTRAVENIFAEFKRRWPMESSDVDGTVASAADFLAKLKRLESDGLPKYEKRFFDLLQTQSHQNLASLSTHLQQALRDIRARMDMVNESLCHAEFNIGTHLRIEVSDHHLPEVREFKQHIKHILSHAFEEDRQRAEQRFLVLQKLVERFNSNEIADKHWKETVLDVRQHVEFIGRELDQEGREIEVHRSGAGKSGGQRQKLATTCLAAALRYQLSGSDHEAPVYAPVVLDEAFDKADNEFTELAMKIFENFGFQMIVATPLKSVMTLEPFIGGACFIDISERQRSSVFLIEYDEERKKLDLPEQSHGGASIAASG